MQDYREHADTYRAMLGDYGWGFNYDEMCIRDSSNAAPVRAARNGKELPPAAENARKGISDLA